MAVVSTGIVTRSQAATATASGVTSSVEPAERPRNKDPSALSTHSGIYNGVSHNDYSPPAGPVRTNDTDQCPACLRPMIRQEELKIYSPAAHISANSVIYGQLYRNLMATD